MKNIEKIKPNGATKKPSEIPTAFCWWALTDSNRRPSACKADALNQLS